MQPSSWYKASEDEGAGAHSQVQELRESSLRTP